MICLFPLKVLVQLENEIGDLETQTGRRPRAEQPRQESFSGYTMSLVDSVTKLSRYLKEVCTCTYNSELLSQGCTCNTDTIFHKKITVKVPI